MIVCETLFLCADLKILYVPIIFVSINFLGDLIELSTCDSAAKFITPSIS